MSQRVVKTLGMMSARQFFVMEMITVLTVKMRTSQTPKLWRRTDSP